MRASPARIPSLRRSLTSSRDRLLVDATSRSAATICPAFIVPPLGLPLEDQVGARYLASRYLDFVPSREAQAHPLLPLRLNEPEQLTLQAGRPPRERGRPLHRDL